MNLLKSISAYSIYRPIGGDLLKLFHLAIEQDVSKVEAVNFFKSQGYYRQLKKDLKDRLLDGILLSSFKELTAIQKIHFKILKRSLKSKMLIQSHERLTGVKIAEETVLNAEKYGLVEVAYTLSRDLEVIYAVNKNQARKYRKYQSKVKTYLKYLVEETQAQSLFAELSYCIQHKKDISHIPAAIDELRGISLDNEQYKFRLTYYSILNLYHQANQQRAEIIKTCKEAVEFFKQSKTILPYTTAWNFRFQLIPIYLSKKEYAKAGQCIKKIIHLPSLGSYNWHLTLLYKVVLGFHSSNMTIAKNAWTLFTSVLDKSDSPVIAERWKVIRAYFVLFAKSGIIDFSKDFRVFRFINDSYPNKTAKINIIVLELLHLLLDGKHKAYMKKVESIESYISNNLRGFENLRPKYFLRMLRAVELGDYNLIRVEAHAKKHKNALRNNSNLININVLDSEPVPYEILWEIVLKYLLKR